MADNFNTLDRPAYGPVAPPVTTTSTFGNTTTETTFVSTALAANSLKVGDTFRLCATGDTDNQATSGTLTIRLKVGGQTLASFALPTQAGAQTDQPWFFEAVVTIRSIGASGTVIGGGFISYEFASADRPIASTAVSTIDTTAAVTIEATAQWQTQSVTNVYNTYAAWVERVR